MENRQFPRSPLAESPRPRASRQRSNSFPIGEALRCSTPEAQLVLAEGRAAVRKRRTGGRRNQSVNDESFPTFNPRDHLKFLDGLASLATPQEQETPWEARSHHSRQSSDATDGSTYTVVPHFADRDLCASPSPTGPLGNYSANLAQFVKDQLKSIPTYQPGNEPTSPLSPRSCPDLSFPSRTPPQSPKRVIQRPVEAPKVIDIPPVRPPMRSAFSAWSSTDDDTDTDEDAPPLPAFEGYTKGHMSNYTHSVLCYYETSHNDASFLFSCTPFEQTEASEPETAKAFTFPDYSALPASSFPPDEARNEHDDDDYLSSCPSHPQLSTSSVPSNTSSSSTSSYFDYKSPTLITTHMKDRIIAAVTPPSHAQRKRFTATSPWEGDALANVHHVFIESQQRVRVDGMSFDMLRDFVLPGRLTPC